MPADSALLIVCCSPGVHNHARMGEVILSERRISASSTIATPSQVAPPRSAARADGTRPCPYPSALTTAITSASVPAFRMATFCAIAARSMTASVRDTDLLSLVLHDLPECGAKRPQHVGGRGWPRSRRQLTRHAMDVGTNCGSPRCRHATGQQRADQ